MMKVLKIDANNPEMGIIKQAITILENGGTVVYPTDTLYGLGVNIYCKKAINKIFTLKKRDFNKPISVCVSKIEDIPKIAYLNENTEKLIKNLFPGPFTVILKKKNNISPILTGGKDNIGIRIPDNKISKELSGKFPITTTSANISGRKIPKSAEGILRQFNMEVDLILDVGAIGHGVHSTVIDATVFPPKVLRSGVQLPKF